MRYLYNPPMIVKKLFNNFIWETSNNKILLTFDDGPNPGTTEIILDELKKYNARAIFFCVGNNINKHPQLSKEIINCGHLIGNHTYNHKTLTKLNVDAIDKEINNYNYASAEVLNVTPKYFRPPHGKFNFGLQKILDKYNLKNVMWSLLTYDYKSDRDITKKVISKYLKRSSIIVLHDSNKSKEIITDSIKMIFEEADNRGYEIGEPEECLK